MIYIIIYLIGYFCSYYLTRYETRRNYEDDYDWGNVAFGAIFSILSWVFVLTMFILILLDRIKNTKVKPPKFL